MQGLLKVKRQRATENLVEVKEGGQVGKNSAPTPKEAVEQPVLGKLVVIKSRGKKWESTARPSSRRQLLSIL